MKSTTSPIAAASSPRVFTVDECAEELKVSPRQVWKFISAGELEAVKLSEGATRITAAALNEFIDTRPLRNPGAKARPV